MVGTWSRCRRGAATAVLVVAALSMQGVLASTAEAATARRDAMASLTNSDRAERGRAPLDLNERLSRYAKRHSAAMAAKGYLFHTADLAAKLKGVDWSIGGENVGVGSNLEELEKAFMSSTLHRRNILRRGFDDMAVGVFVDADRYWVTVIFYG